jgi:type IV conjugative transfer system coupling protein TraD
MGFTKNFTQGGQVTLHNFHMIRQVMSVTLLATLIVGGVVFGTKSWYDFTPYERSSAVAYYWADFKLNLPFVRNEQRRKMTQFYTYDNGKQGTVRSIDIVTNRWHRWLVQDINNQLVKNAWLTLWVMVSFFLIVCTGWAWRGKAKKAKEILSGNEIIKPKLLQKLLRRQKIASPLKLGNVSLRLNSETQHLMLCGTTGTGKSNCFMQLFPQIRAMKQRAIVVDTTGEFVNRFYREGKDILINPFDERSVGWSPWDECLKDYHYDEIAHGFIPQTGDDSFWADSSRTVFAECLRYLDSQRTKSVVALRNLVLYCPLVDIYKNLKDTPAANLLDPSGEKTAMSIRSHLAPYLKALKYLPKDKFSFSIREWIENWADNEHDDSWLFITSTPDQRETLRPLITGLMTIAVNSVMSTAPNPDRRVWFMIDELISLNKQEAIPKALAEIRKYGGCIAAGVQNIPQLQEQYGLSETKSLTSLFNTKVIFRNGDPETAKYMSQMLGEQEIMESVEGISYGAHQMRDGVSLNEQKRMKPVVSATEIMSLNDLEAYLKLPGNLPVTKLKFQVNAI